MSDITPVSRRSYEVWWCPRCECQSRDMHHPCSSGPPLFPQLAEYTTCERIEVVPVIEVERLREALDGAARALERVQDGSLHPGRNLARAITEARTNAR